MGDGACRPTAGPAAVGTVPSSDFERGCLTLREFQVIAAEQASPGCTEATLRC